MISMISMTFLGRIDVVEKSGNPERSFVFRSSAVFSLEWIMISR